ncbi:peptidoglycan-binding protein LysM [Spirochaetia bacterium]|nr:peptidoglycan-binding protein LysM [Spirochaetia bacterium]
MKTSNILIFVMIFCTIRLFAQEATYLVQNGDSVSTIAYRFDISSDDLMKRNNIANALSLRSGQRLFIPGTSIHIVLSGQTLYGIARQYGISVSKLRNLNNIPDSYMLKVEDKLIVPATAMAQPEQSAQDQVSAPAVNAVREHLVLAGETFYGLGRRYGTDEQTIRKLNNFSDSYVLKTGDRIKVPGTPPEQTEGSASDQSIIFRPVQTVESVPLKWPVSAKDVIYTKGKVSGVMLSAERSEPVKNVMYGTVISADNYHGFGKVVIVEVAGGYIYLYGGMESISVKVHDIIAPGTELGIASHGEKPQILFLVYQKNKPIDPASAPRA